MKLYFVDPWQVGSKPYTCIWIGEPCLDCVDIFTVYLACYLVCSWNIHNIIYIFFLTSDSSMIVIFMTLYWVHFLDQLYHKCLECQSVSKCSKKKINQLKLAQVLCAVNCNFLFTRTVRPWLSILFFSNREAVDLQLDTQN